MKPLFYEDDNFTKELELIKDIKFDKEPSLNAFKETVAKLEGVQGFKVDASFVTSPGATAIYKAFVHLDFDHKRLYLLFPRQDEKLLRKVYAIGRKVINEWESGFDAKFAPRRYGTFKNNPFEILKRIK